MPYICQFKDGGKNICGDKFDDEMDAMMHLAYGHALLDDGKWIKEESE